VSGATVTLEGWPDMNLKSGLLLAKDKVTKDGDKKEMLEELYERGVYVDPRRTTSTEDDESDVEKSIKDTVAGLQAKAASMSIRA
jgi:hypothetical protein